MDSLLLVLFLISAIGLIGLALLLWQTKTHKKQTIQKESINLAENSAAPQIKEPIKREELKIIRLIAKEPYLGTQLVQALQAAHLHYGEMGIFHRYYLESDRRKILFSVASLVRPGAFDCESMSHTQYPGLCFFMIMPQLTDPDSIFALMLQTAEQLQRDLGGSIEVCQRNN